MSIGGFLIGLVIGSPVGILVADWLIRRKLRREARR